ncbi:MAG: Cupin 4 [Myxococcales bacterium]|nr:Cupin 4 [Myxococcales bacterium]
MGEAPAARLLDGRSPGQEVCDGNWRLARHAFMVPGMFADWLKPVEVSTFIEAQLERQPYARPGAATGSVPLFGWETFDRVLASTAAPVDVLTVAAGRLVDVPAPRSAADVQRLMRVGTGVSTVVRASEQHDPALAALAESFSTALSGEVHVQLYATPAGTHSYGWHYDFEDVFIAQTLGIKDYYFRDNTVARDTRLGDTLDFTVVRDEKSQLMGAQLLAGDWLYIPRRWWHLVKCVEDSLSISVGVMPLEAIAGARRIPAGWSGKVARPG